VDLVAHCRVLVDFPPWRASVLTCWPPVQTWLPLGLGERRPPAGCAGRYMEAGRGAGPCQETCSHSFSWNAG